MLSGLKREWRKLGRAEMGRRFVEQYERHQTRHGPWLKPIVVFSVVLAFGMGVVLLVVPGASIGCFAIAALLLPFVSRPVAVAYDRLELMVRGSRARSAAKREQHEAPDEASRETAKLDRSQPDSQATSVQQPSDPRVVWIKPAAPPQPPVVAATTRIWSSDLPVTPTPIRRRPAAQSAPVRPSQAVILVPPPVTITNRADNRPAPAARATVPLRRRSQA